MSVAEQKMKMTGLKALGYDIKKASCWVLAHEQISLGVMTRFVETVKSG